MKFAAFLALLSATLIPAVRAAPPGVMQYETLASPTNCGGEDLFSIGWLGSSGVSCTSLSDGAPTDYWLNYFLAKCSINLYSEAGCADDTLVLNIPAPGNPGNEFCINVAEGFRALTVTCTS